MKLIKHFLIVVTFFAGVDLYAMHNSYLCSTLMGSEFILGNAIFFIAIIILVTAVLILQYKVEIYRKLTYPKPHKEKENMSDISDQISNNEFIIIESLIKLSKIQVWVWSIDDGTFNYIGNENSKESEIKTVDDFFESIYNADVKSVSIAVSDYINQTSDKCYVQFRNKQGDTWYELHAYTLDKNEKNKPTQIIGLQKDVSEQKRLNQLSMESQKMETISRLAGGMAHDLNNMLQVISGFTELSMTELDTTSEVYHNLQHAMEGAEQAKSLVEQLLTFSQEDINRPFPLQVSVAINNFTNMITRKLKKLNIELRVHNAAGNIKIYADPKKLDQILDKLVENAINAIGDKGIIQISVSKKNVEKEMSRYGLTIQTGKYIVISVEDNGCGIKSGTKPLIFDPFFTTKDIGEGRGLGLSTVYNCVKAHQGFINVISRPDMDGTKFDVYFPVYDLMSKHNNESSVANANKRTSGIMIVDDFQQTINMIKNYMDNSSYHFYESNSGKDALETFNKFYDDIDLIILDCIITDINGIDVYKQMKKIKKDLPVIFISGFTKKDVEKQVGEEIEHIFLSKPIQKDLLVEAVENLL